MHYAEGSILKRGDTRESTRVKDRRPVLVATCGHKNHASRAIQIYEIQIFRNQILSFLR